MVVPFDDLFLLTLKNGFLRCGLLISFLSLLSCGLPASERAKDEQPSNLQTDLGMTGNSRVVRRFNAYRQSGRTGCNAGGTHTRRILLSGFSSFNRKENISGAVIDVLQRSDVWPAQTVFPSRAGFEPPEFEPNDDPGMLGSTAVQRTLRYDGTEVEVCLVKVSVEWDFAAAVILHEAERFQPQFILMTGYGSNPTGMRLEAGALNRTRPLSGFDPQGRPLGELNSPLSQWIVPPDLQLPDEIFMNWMPAKIAERNRQRLMSVSESVGRGESQTAWNFVAMRAADPLNDYICNNVSYAVLAALRVESIPLAGGKLTVKPRFAVAPSAAFVHYPFDSDVSSAAEVWSWAHLLMSLSGSVLEFTR